MNTVPGSLLLVSANGALMATSMIKNMTDVDTLSNKSQYYTIPSISIDVSEVGHGITKTRVASSSLDCPHKLKTTL